MICSAWAHAAVNKNPENQHVFSKQSLVPGENTYNEVGKCTTTTKKLETAFLGELDYSTKSISQYMKTGLPNLKTVLGEETKK